MRNNSKQISIFSISLNTTLIQFSGQKEYFNSNKFTSEIYFFNQFNILLHIFQLGFSPQPWSSHHLLWIHTFHSCWIYYCQNNRFTRICELTSTNHRNIICSIIHSKLIPFLCPYQTHTSNKRHEQTLTQNKNAPHHDNQNTIRSTCACIRNSANMNGYYSQMRSRTHRRPTRATPLYYIVQQFIQLAHHHHHHSDDEERSVAGQCTCTVVCSIAGLAPPTLRSSPTIGGMFIHMMILGVEPLHHPKKKYIHTNRSHIRPLFCDHSWLVAWNIL